MAQEKSLLIELLQENSEIIFHHLKDTTSLSIIFTDLEGTILECNKGFLDNLGLTEKPIMKNIITLLSHNHDDIFLQNLKALVDVSFHLKVISRLISIY